MAITLSPEKTAQSTAPKISRPRLHYLDGVRGLAALFVVFSHVHKDIMARADAANLPHWFAAFNWLYWGHYSVDVFIVLSGYCLMLPLAKSQTKELRGGMSGFMKRRARRILPPYYAALALSLLLIALVPGLRHPVGGTPIDSLHTELPAFASPVLLSHIFLVQNLGDGWFFKINSPMWSVASEWQIYFFFPLLLLPVWRRFGIASAVGTALLVGVGAHFVLQRKLDIACPWFLALFAMGMAGAVKNFGAAGGMNSETRPFPWGGISAAAAGGVVAFTWLRPVWTNDHYYLIDLFVGLATASLLISCTGSLLHNKTPVPIVPRILDSPGTVGLGVFSYSLYLIHMPLLVSMEALYTQAHFGPLAEFWVLLTVGVPIIIVISYGFHLLIERRFMNTPSK